jgi:predicted nucleic acid-binding OB-fold protein
MPKLNTEQLMERIQKRIHQLELGEEVAAKDIKALLNAKQQHQLVDALTVQAELKKNKYARSEQGNMF